MTDFNAGKCCSDACHVYVEFWRICYIIWSMAVSYLVTALLCALALSAAAQNGPLIRVGELWRFHKAPMDAHAPSARWHHLDFEDAHWEVALSGIVLPDDDEPPSAQKSKPGRAFLRKTFAVRSPRSITSLQLSIEHEDGFVAYLNGTEIARESNKGHRAHWSRKKIEEVVLLNTRLDISRHAELLVEGENVLAVEGPYSGESLSTVPLAAMVVAGVLRGPIVVRSTPTSVAIVFRTADQSGWVEFGPTAAMGSTVTNIPAGADSLVALTNLQPDTTYYYRVGYNAEEGTQVTAVETFRTLRQSGPASFSVFGDSGQATTAQTSIAERMRNTPVDLVLHTGDIIYGLMDDNTADTRFYNYYGAQMRRVPFFLSMGNHDEWPHPDGGFWFEHVFYSPSNSLNGRQIFYSFDHGDAHFVALFMPWFQSYILDESTDQYGWLTNDLARTAKRWKFLFFHMPVANSGIHSGNDQNFNTVRDRVELMNTIGGVAGRYGVDFVFCGHDHNFERFAPTNGMHYIVTGGGGGGTYNFASRHPASAQFWSRNHFVKIDVRDDTLKLQAINTDGNVFDRMVVHRALAQPRIYPSTWNTPTIETNLPDNDDGNITGQTFNLAGSPVLTRRGQDSNLGEFYVNNDSTNLYLGIRSAMYYGNNNIFVFVESPRQGGVSTMAGVGNGMIDPGGEGADGLDCLENLSFVNFTPSVGCILGDELADGTSRSFTRTGLGLDIGQGVFGLSAGLAGVTGAQIQQFNRSPETLAEPGERNADLIEVAIPFAALGGVQPGDVIKVAAIVAGDAYDAGLQTRELDTAVLATQITGAGQGPVVLGGVSFRLAFPPDLDTDGDGLFDNWEVAYDLNVNSPAGPHGAAGDPDGDGYSNAQEQVAGTDPRDAASALRLTLRTIAPKRFRVGWQAVEGKRYQLEYADALPAFASLTGTEWPRTAVSSEEFFEDDVSTNSPPIGSRLYRVRLEP